jgi:hypothetical protein
MAVQVEAGGDLAKALQDVVNPKLIEVGWSTGEQDDTLSEYIILMIANGKSQDEIAVELARDLLDLSPDDQSAAEFARWLFEQVSILSGQPNPSSDIHHTTTDSQSDMQMQGATPAETQLGDGVDRPIPTGPKAMRSGNTKPNGNRMFNQINRALDRSGDSSLHRIQGATGSGRINSHSGRGNLRGNKGQQIQRNFDGANRRSMKNNAMVNQGAFGFPMQGQGQGQGQGQMEQAQLLQMLEHQARIMTQIASSHGLMNPAFVQQNQPFGQSGPQQSNGRSLAERMGGRGPNRKQQRKPHNGDNDQAAEDASMGEDGDLSGQAGENKEDSNDISKVICKFNLYCTKPDCPYAHQSPAAPPGVTIDLGSDCTFGAACKNHKCVSRHPSPAKKFEHQQQQNCKFGPFCQNPKCQFKHSNAKPCRNGSDCDTPGCAFFHSPIECKFNPCTNAHCIYKHKDGQRTSGGAGNVWTQEGASHISDRKFVEDENGQEELVIPDSVNQEPVNQGAESASAEHTVMS